MSHLSVENALTFDGEFFVDELDGVRLTKQIAVIRHILYDGEKYSVYDVQRIAKKKFRVHIPTLSIQTQIRNLRKEKNGGYDIEGKYFEVEGKEKPVFMYRFTPRWASDPQAPAIIEKIPDVEITDSYIRIRDGVTLPYGEWANLNNKAILKGFKKIHNRLWRK